jgi:hypothetical protein
MVSSSPKLGACLFHLPSLFPRTASIHEPTSFQAARLAAPQANYRLEPAAPYDVQQNASGTRDSRLDTRQGSSRAESTGPASVPCFLPATGTMMPNGRPCFTHGCKLFLQCGALSSTCAILEKGERCNLYYALPDGCLRHEQYHQW